jgi:hypothetical protein
MRRLGQKLSNTLTVVTVLLALFYLLPNCLSNTSNSYQLLNHPDGSTYYKLNVTVPQSLYEYYQGKTHQLNSENDFAKFVTPYALKPIADSLLEIYADDEDFANGALMIAHQMPYKVTAPSKYPVETIVDNEGDCDLFCYITASIMKANGLDVVLLYYELETHMNIGISLSHVPRDSRGEAFYVTNNNVKYYVAECTGGMAQGGWRVGECPEELANASAQVITLESCEQSAPGQVSAAYKALQPSTLILTSSTAYAIQGTTITLSGQLSPNLQEKNVTIYFKANNSPWMALDTVKTDSNGHFDYAWNINAGGICYLRASWSGDDDYALAESPIRTITSLSTFFILLLVITVILVFVGAFAYLMSRQTQQGYVEPQAPEIPS